MPATKLPLKDQPIMQARAAALPELHHLRHDHVTAPIGGTRRVIAELLLGVSERFFQRLATSLLGEGLR